MPKNIYTYHATVHNDSGAGERAGSDSNLARLKKEIRHRYGKGWIVTITRVQHDGINGWFEPETVERFKIRG